MRHSRSDYESIQPWPTKRPHIAKLDGTVIELDIDAVEPLGLEELIPDDEPVFVLRAKDGSAPEVVEFWASLNREHGADPELCDRAAEWAGEMAQYASIHYNGGKIPDVPSGALK